MRSVLLLAALALPAFAACAAESTLLCRGRVIESTIDSQKVGDITTDRMTVDDDKRTVFSNNGTQPVSKFSPEAIEITKAGSNATAVITVDRVTGDYSVRIIGEGSPLRLIVGGECRDLSKAAMPGESQGSVKHAVYSNPALGIDLKIPRGWEANHAFMEKRLAALPDEVRRTTLLTAIKMDKDQVPRAMVLVNAEKVVGTLTAADYVEAGRRVSQKRPGVVSVSVVATESIAGVPYATTVVTSGTGAEEVRVKSFARVHRGHVILFMVTTTGGEVLGSRERYEVEQMLGSIHYK